MFSTGKSYNPNDIDEIEEEQAERLYQRGVVDILKDEEFIKSSEEDVEISDMTVAELKELANKKDVAHSGLRKAELIEAIKEVL